MLPASPCRSVDAPSDPKVDGVTLPSSDQRRHRPNQRLWRHTLVRIASRTNARQEPAAAIRPSMLPELVTVRGRMTSLRLLVAKTPALEQPSNVRAQRGPPFACQNDTRQLSASCSRACRIATSSTVLSTTRTSASRRPASIRGCALANSVRDRTPASSLSAT